MTMLDQFESVFRAAAKTVYRYRALSFRKVLVVTDVAAEAAQAFATRALAPFGEHDATILSAGDADTVGQLLEAVQREAPDVVCTYRNLHSGAWRWPYTLGDHVEVLTQVTAVPVLLMPRPDIEAALERTGACDRVMAMTDHLEGAEHLVNAAVALTRPGGTVLLTHVEDDAVFERYMEAAGRTPKIDTEVAREALLDTLLKGPRDYVRTCAEALAAEATIDLTVEPVIEMGHHLSMYKSLVRTHDVDLLVMNAKDDDQLAMHGLAYPLAVELRDTPLLML